MKIAKQIKVRSSEASEVIPYLMERGLIDITSKISKEGEYRIVPIEPGKEDILKDMGYELFEGSAYTVDRRSPQERILNDMSDLPEEILRILPMKWEYVGDIAILKMDDRCRPYKERIGKTYSEILGVGSVCADICGVSGEFRRPEMEVIYGKDTESVRLENGIFYEFDVSKIMFASGNTDERQRMKELNCKGETVVDMFAGIGYFTLPIAKFTAAKRIFACEKNPDSYRYLLKNTVRNGVSDKIIPILGDNRDMLGKAYADRIIMGYVQRTSEFVPKALEMIKKGGMIHYHDTFYVNEYEERINDIFEDAAGKERYAIENIKEVKSFAPSVSHYAADIRIL